MGFNSALKGLTFKSHVSYIQDGRTATLQMLHFIYFFKNMSTEYFKHAAHFPFFSSKFHLFHNAKFFVPVLFKFYIQDVLKCKCQKIKISYIMPTLDIS
jgi:hypothetical protein